MFCPLIAAVKTGISPAVRSGGQPLTPQPNKRGLIAATVAGLGLGLAALLTLCKTSAAPGLTPPPPANYIHLARAAEEETPPRQSDLQRRPQSCSGGIPSSGSPTTSLSPHTLPACLLGGWGYRSGHRLRAKEFAGFNGAWCDQPAAGPLALGMSRFSVPGPFSRVFVFSLSNRKTK